MLRVILEDGGNKNKRETWGLWHLAWSMAWRTALVLFVISFIIGTLAGGCQVGYVPGRGQPQTKMQNL